jgi:hypothetical protein
MKGLVTTVVALSFVAGLAGHADAATDRKKKRLQASHYGKHYSRVYSYRRSNDGYHEQLLQAVPFGSKQWWEIYERQRGARR